MAGQQGPFAQERWTCGLHLGRCAWDPELGTEISHYPNPWSTAVHGIQWLNPITTDWCPLREWNWTRLCHITGLCQQFNGVITGMNQLKIDVCLLINIGRRKQCCLASWDYRENISLFHCKQLHSTRTRGQWMELNGCKFRTKQRRCSRQYLISQWNSQEVIIQILSGFKKRRLDNFDRQYYL